MNYKQKDIQKVQKKVLNMWYKPFEALYEALGIEPYDAGDDLETSLATWEEVYPEFCEIATDDVIMEMCCSIIEDTLNEQIEKMVLLMFLHGHYDKVKELRCENILDSAIAKKWEVVDPSGSSE